MVPDFAGQDGSCHVEGDKGNPDAHPASDLQCKIMLLRLPQLSAQSTSCHVSHQACCPGRGHEIITTKADNGHLLLVR